MTCPKCQGRMRQRKEFLPADGPVEAWSCPRCGKWVDVAKEAKPCRPDVYEKPKRSRKAIEKGKKSRLLFIEKNTFPCTIAGCTGTYYASKKGRPVCQKHSRQLINWAKKPRKTPPPIYEKDGQWYARTK